MPGAPGAHAPQVGLCEESKFGPIRCFVSNISGIRKCGSHGRHCLRGQDLLAQSLSETTSAIVSHRQPMHSAGAAPEAFHGHWHSVRLRHRTQEATFPLTRVQDCFGSTNYG